MPFNFLSLFLFICFSASVLFHENATSSVAAVSEDKAVGLPQILAADLVVWMKMAQAQQDSSTEVLIGNILSWKGSSGPAPDFAWNSPSTPTRCLRALSKSCWNFGRLLLWPSWEFVLAPTHPLGEESIPNIQPKPHCFLWGFESQGAGVCTAKPLTDLADRTWVCSDLDLGNAGPAWAFLSQLFCIPTYYFALHIWVLFVYLTATCFHFMDVLLTGFMINNLSCCIL